LRADRKYDHFQHMLNYADEETNINGSRSTLNRNVWSWTQGQEEEVQELHCLSSSETRLAN